MFEGSRPHQVFGSVVESALPLPSGQSLSPALLQAVSDLPIQLNLKEIGHITPWAIQFGGIGWEAVDRPSENLRLYQMPPEKIREGFNKLFGQPIPYLGIITRSLPTQAEIERALSGTDYELYETQAAYSQADRKDTPDILFFHWVSLRPLGTKAGKSMKAALAAMNGALVFAEREPFFDTAKRAHPSVPFIEAFNSRMPSAPLNGTGFYPAPLNPFPSASTESSSSSSSASAPSPAPSSNTVVLDEVMVVGEVPVKTYWLVLAGVSAAALSYLIARRAR